MAEIRVNATGELKLYDSDDSNYVSFKSGGTVSSNVTWTLPTADGSSGQMLSTDGSGTLSWATASSADPSSADGDSLGTASAEWSDLYLADGGIIYLGNDQDVKLTHNADKGLIIKHAATADDKPVILTLQTGETDMAQDDVMGKIEFQAPDEGTGTDAILVAAAIQAVAEGDFSSSSNATRLEFMTGSSEAATSQMTISSGGIVGIGAVPTGDLGVGLHIKTADSGASANSLTDELVIEGSGDSGLNILSGTSSSGAIYFGDSGDDDAGRIVYYHGDNSFRFVTSGSERMRLKDNGDININKTVNDRGTKGTVIYESSGGVGHTSDGDTALMLKRISSTGNIVDFTYGGTATGNISVAASSTAYNTSSDYRLKENETAITDGIDRVKQLKPYKFNFKVDATKTLDGFFAHEVSSIVPEAITGEKDAVKKEKDKDGNNIIIPQGIDQAKLVPLLTSALQEAITKIETLETKVKTLEDA